MKIDIVDHTVEKDIFTYRVCKIKYSFAYENYLKDKLSLLKKEYNVFQIKDLFLQDEKVSNNGKLKEWGVGIFKNLLGLIPSYGAGLTILFSISDTIKLLKTSDLEEIKEKFQIKEKPRKKYKKIKNILIINNVSYLTADEIEKTRFIQKLIEYKYIVNTLLIICEPLDFPSGIFVNNEAIYRLYIDNNTLLRNLGICLSENGLKLLNVLGVEYAECIRNLDTDPSLNSDMLVKKLIADMLQRAGYDEEESILDFLKLCSLLFDVFSCEDIEQVSEIKNISYEQEMTKTIDSRIIESDVPDAYKFFVNFVRKYYQSSAQRYSSKVKKQILDYLKHKYPKKYTDLALASILTSDSKEEKLSLCLKALYYDKDSSTVYKTNEIIDYLSKTEYATLTNILQLDNIYYIFDYSQTDVKSLCKKSFYGLSNLNFLSTEDKLICLSSIAKVSYELMDQPFLLEVDVLYRKMLNNIGISTTYNQYASFILDYVVFSTCIENSFETRQAVQRLISYLQKSKLSLQNKIKYSRIGNALFYNDHQIGLELTKDAYDLSVEYVLEHKYATINYSCSLGMCGDYKKAEEVLITEFDKTLFNRDAISISATNNYIIASYLNKSNDTKWLIRKLSDLYKKISDITFSDQQIVCNNLLAAYIVDNVQANHSIIEKLSETINDSEDDPYHLFYMHQNMMVFYFLSGNYEGFSYERSLCIIPGLLSPYKTFFEGKADFLENNICNNWSIQHLQKQLTKWGERYPEIKYSLYKNSILFGFIERWFE